MLHNFKILTVLFLYLLMFTNIPAQERISFQITDSLTKKPLSFVKIIFVSKNNGTYSNRKGYATLSNLQYKDSILVQHIGYEPKILSVKDIHKKQNIKLKPKSYTLSKIDIKSKGFKIYETGFQKKAVTSSFWSSQNIGNEIAVLIQNDKKETAFINEIIFYIKKNAKNNPLLRIHLYKNKNNSPGDELFLKNNIITVTKSKVVFNIEEQYINFPRNGFFVSIEWLGKYYLNNKLYNDTSLFLNPKIKAVNAKKVFSYYKLWEKSWERIPFPASIPAIKFKIEVYNK